MLGRLIFFLIFTVTVAILIVPVILTILFWVITNRGLMWIVKVSDKITDFWVPKNKG